MSPKQFVDEALRSGDVSKNFFYVSESIGIKLPPATINAISTPQAGKRGAQPVYSDLAIETALSLVQVIRDV